MKISAQKNDYQTKEKLNYKSLLRIFLIIVKEFFVFALIFYLILFILENFFPGFVSNNFSLNYVLFTVIYASVLFVGSVTTKFSSRRLNQVSFVIGVVIFTAITVSMFVFMPIAME